ncbi:MAG: hypothetical protein SOU05_03650 [Atopobium sp.]|uniref:hypothetical protein n=1 Tax=Atopobium sp. TaxID=1872650 RepID=UPI002A75E4FB|nr:hypothetical protein [Atopobium sp.]MDY2788484.1 hypothetical protein [Atopobium sp.]MDY4523208.1 hypothetical protein [Atopobium sp.]
MIYVGNFSYNDTTEDEENYCLIPCMVVADDVDEALDKFATQLITLHEEGDLLSGADYIYLDSLVELTGECDEPVMLNWQKIAITNEGLSSISSALPGADEAAGVAYAFVNDTDEDFQTEFDDPNIDFADLEEADEEPFLDFTVAQN